MVDCSVRIVLCPESSLLIQPQSSRTRLVRLSLPTQTTSLANAGLASQRSKARPTHTALSKPSSAPKRPRANTPPAAQSPTSKPSVPGPMSSATAAASKNAKLPRPTQHLTLPLPTDRRQTQPRAPQEQLQPSPRSRLSRTCWASAAQNTVPHTSTPAPLTCIP